MFKGRRQRYHQKIAEGLSEAHAGAVTEDVVASDTRIIVFSDLHRGAGDRADDFRRCKRIYHGALGYYDSLDYRLFLLGDIEEMWERLLFAVIRTYEQTLQLEQRFFERGRGERFVGNHDEHLKWPWHEKKLAPYLAGRPLRDTMRLRFFEKADDPDPMGEMFFAHGHQGIEYNGFHRFVVRRLWAPFQKLTGKGAGVPSQDPRIRQTHERAMYNWAISRADQNLLLVAGHTHHPVFMSTAWQETIRNKFNELSANPDATPEQLAMAEAEVRWAEAAAEESRSALPSGGRPCYFNAGCCSFVDGTITGIEIADEEIRLVRWNDFSGLPKREVLRAARLTSVFGSCCE